MPYSTSEPVLVIDGNNLCWKNYHAMKKAILSVGDVQTGMMYGVFRDLIRLADEFQTSQILWCFDAMPTKRLAIYPEYKGNRKTGSDKEKAIRFEVKKQIDRFKTILKELGFRNIYWKEGFEADDLLVHSIKCVRKAIGEDAKLVLITSDQDMYQCLARGVTIYDMRNKKRWTKLKFKSRYGIPPKQWAMVKAIAGCGSDNVKGVEKVGEITAIKHLLGTLDPKSKAAEAIAKASPIIQRNLKLVKLPIDGCPDLPIGYDQLSQGRWQGVMQRYNMTSLLRGFPW